MNALVKNGINEAAVEIGTLVTWQSKDFLQFGDVVSYIERDDHGTITRIAFASWINIFTDRMKLHVELARGDANGMYKNAMAQVGRWYMLAQQRGLITIN